MATRRVTLEREWRADAIGALPAFGSIAALLARLPRERFPTRADLNALAAVGDSPLRFVAATDGESAADYERRIARAGEVATRTDSWHDCLNALVWCAFPRTKAELNRIHVAALDQPSGIGRGRARDRATLFDEGGVIIACADEALAAALYAFEWKRLFWDERERVTRQMAFHLFGHGLLEKALAPYKAMTGNALVIPVTRAALADRAHLDALAAERIATARLTPLPILGIPGWCSDNETAGFYEDPKVFRQRPISRPKSVRKQGAGG